MWSSSLGMCTSPLQSATTPFTMALVYEIGATPLHALCLPPPPNGPADTSLNPTLLFAGDVAFGGALQNFGSCDVDSNGRVTLSLHDVATGRILYEFRADAWPGGVRVSTGKCATARE